MANDFHAYQHRTNKPHYCNEYTFWCKKRKYDIRIDGKRKDLYFDNLELAVYKQVVIKCRSAGVSYHKLASAFSLSSRTVYNWVTKIHMIKRFKLNVNIQAVRIALFSWIQAYRNGWVEEINVDRILSGDGIH